MRPHRAARHPTCPLAGAQHHTIGGPAGDDPGNPGGYGVEHVIRQTNQSFKAALTTSGTSFHDLSHLGGFHGWPYWQRALHLVLPEVVGAID